jgi:hypothetical protein
MKINEAIPSQHRALILMVAGHQKIGRRILEHLRKKDTRALLTKNPHRAAKEAEQQITTPKIALTHLNLILHVPWKHNQPPHQRLPYLS